MNPPRISLPFAAELANPASPIRVLLDSMTEGVSLSREDGTVVYTNPAEDRLFGYEPGELWGQHVSVQNAYPPKENDRIVGVVIEDLKRSGSWTGEWRNRRKDGSEFMTRSRISAVEIDGERHWLCVQEDVTEQAATTRALQEERSRLAVATEAAEIGIWDWDLGSSRMTYSQRAKAICGFPLDRPVTFEDARRVTHPEDLPRTSAQARRALDPAIRDREPFEYRIIRDDGSLRWVLAHGEAVFEEVDDELRAVRYLGTLQDVTARHELEEAERRATQRLRLAIEAGHMAVWDVDMVRDELVGSPELNRLLGFPEHEALDIHAVRACYYPGELERLRGEFQKALARGETSFDADLRFIRPDGSHRWFLLRCEALTGEDGKPVRAIGILFDETERRQAEAQVRASEEELRLLADALPLLVSFIDGDERYVLVNRTYEDWFGRPRDEILGRTMREVLGDEAYAVRKPQVEAALRGEQVRFEAFTPMVGGGRRDTELQYLPRRDAEGGVSGFYVVVADITERHRTEAALQRETRALAIVNETGAAVAAERDLERIVQMVTDAGRELTGAEFGAFFYNVLNERGESMMLYTLSGAEQEAFSKFPMPRATDVFRPTLHGESVIRSDDILADPRYGKNAPYKGMPEGHLPVRSYLAMPVTSRSGEVLGGLFYGHGEPGKFQAEHETLLSGIAGHAATAIDNARLFQANERELAERRRAEVELQALNATLEQRVAEALTEREQAEEALRQAQKMEALGQLTGGIAHDFNNLLQAVQGSFALILKRPEDAHRVRSLAEQGLQATRRGGSLAAQLLAFSRSQQLEVQPVAVGQALAGMHDLLQRSLGPLVTIVLRPVASDLTAYVDPTQLEMAVLNLSINARDAMPEGGTITIYAEPKRVASDPELEPGDYVVVHVKDTGSGMTREVAQRAFEPFFTTKGLGKGTGLGLSQVYAMARQSGGTVRLDTHPGQGTTVCLFLRRSEELSREKGTSAPPTEEEPKTTAATILVVDDDEDVRRWLATALEMLGYRVLEAPNGPAGVAALDQAPDLLLVDFAMPGMNGAEVVQAARRARPDLPIILATGYADTGAVKEVLDPSLVVLRKPFELDALEAALRSKLVDAALQGRHSGI